jgi:DBF zinc finger
LVEELSGNFKPIICREYPEDSACPRIYQNHSSRTVFAPNSIVDEEASEEDVAKTFQNSAASGLRVSQTTAPVERTAVDLSKIAKLNARAATLANQKNGDASTNLPVKRNAPEPVKARKKPKFKRRANVFGMGFYTRPGYCENCNVKYEEFHKHLAVSSINSVETASQMGKKREKLSRT